MYTLLVATSRGICGVECWPIMATQLSPTAWSSASLVPWNVRHNRDKIHNHCIHSSSIIRIGLSSQIVLMPLDGVCINCHVELHSGTKVPWTTGSPMQWLQEMERPFRRSENHLREVKILTLHLTANNKTPCTQSIPVLYFRGGH